MTVYLAIARDAGVVKIGMTYCVRSRVRQLSSRGYGRVELLAAIDGGRTREEALKWLMRDEVVEGEWFKDGFRLRSLADAMRWHDLGWLLVPERVPGPQLRKALIKRYGDLSAAAIALDGSFSRMRSATTDRGYFSPVIYGRFLVEQALDDPWLRFDNRLRAVQPVQEAA